MSRVIPCLMVLRMISLRCLIFRLHQQVGKCIEWAGSEVLPDQVMWERNSQFSFFGGGSGLVKYIISLVEIRCLFYTVRRISSWECTPEFLIWCCALGTVDGRNPKQQDGAKTL